MIDLKTLPNVGENLAAELIAVGVTSAEALRALGAKAAWKKLKARDPSACLHRLYALEGAVRGVRKADLPPEAKAELKAFFHAETSA